MTLQFSSLYYAVLVSNLRTSLVKSPCIMGFTAYINTITKVFQPSFLEFLILELYRKFLKLKYLDLLQYIVIQQEIKDSDCYDTLFISIRFDIIFHDYNFFEKVI